MDTLTIDNNMNVVEIEYGSSLYKEELELRNIILRKPLNRNIYDEVSGEEKNYWHFGTMQNEILIACLVIMPIDNTSTNAGQMAVADHLQGAGVGKKLIGTVENILISRGIKFVHLSARTSAEKFYQKLGYKNSGDTFTKVGIPHIKMTKNLVGH